MTKTSVNERLWSFLDQLAFVHKNKAQVFHNGFNRAENDLDFKVNAQVHKKQVDTKFFHIIRIAMVWHLKK